jgi:drug/metabolite transporter (DMT)-like permease
VIDLHTQRYALMALLAAALFGVSTPLAKLLLNGQTTPQMLAGLLYLGSGVGLLVIWLLQRRKPTAATEKPLAAKDWPWLLGATLCGGAIAPVLLLWGLKGSGASSASLLLNLEGVLTTLVAALVFREAVGRQIWLAAGIMLAASSLLAYDPSSHYLLSLHSLAVIGGCLFWALDNNLTRNISASDPVAITMVKGLVAGSVNLGLALLLGNALPSLGGIAAGMLLGLLSYGISLVLFIYALRHIGSARTAAHFSTAPFFGAVLAVVVLGEPLTLPFIIALGLMVIATWLVLRESHQHEHTHHPMTHEHRHVHDAHHQHTHDGSEGAEPHSHAHRHEPLTHSHAHLPDIHHRHTH